MALHPCPECQKDVSDQAPSCPHCGMPLRAAVGSARRRLLARIAAGLVLAGLALGGAAVALREPDYSRVEQLRAEQDAEGGTRSEHVRQRFFRLYKKHPQNAMYTYLWARCVDDAAKQLELAQQGIHADGRFSWNYNLAARALARLGRVPEAYDQALKGAALDPGNMQLAEKQRALKLILDHKLTEQAKPAPSDRGATRYQGLFHGAIRSPERSDLQAIEKSRPSDVKGPLADAVRGFVVCANPFADTCLHVYVPRDARFKAAWARPDADVGALTDLQLVTVTGTVVTSDKGESLLLADAVTVEAP